MNIVFETSSFEVYIAINLNIVYLTFWLKYTGVTQEVYVGVFLFCLHRQCVFAQEGRP